MQARIAFTCRHHLRVVALVVSAMGCQGTTTTPELAEGTFVLRSVAGEPLPASVRVDQFGGEFANARAPVEPIARAIADVCLESRRCTSGQQ